MSRIPESKQPVRRLFIDPASNSTGWALFEGKQLLTSGTITADGEKNSFVRLEVIGLQYETLGARLRVIDECHIERMAGRPSHIVHHSVGVIGYALGAYCLEVNADIPVQSWQKHCDWKTTKAALEAYKGRVASEDELAAIGMGLYYTNKVGET